MGKLWNVKIDEQMYNLELKGKKLLVNGEDIKLKKYRKKTGLIHEEYEFPLGSKTAFLDLRNMNSSVLVIDNKNCDTGEEYVPIKTPGWAYIFVVLHCLNFLNGALGAAFAVIGIMLTVSISSNRKMNVVVRVLLDLAILVVAVIAIFAVALMLTGLV
ncbi:MAG: hypothetical protein HFI44_04180 [Lachnospiraceae bacterium]|nr:hypothetical protein [Lachnospiraceae bacterium]GFI01519.1 hypothetical protein IMSAGC005_00342 [Lachnospiraceae bacterium]